MISFWRCGISYILLWMLASVRTNMFAPIAVIMETR